MSDARNKAADLLHEWWAYNGDSLIDKIELALDRKDERIAELEAALRDCREAVPHDLIKRLVDAVLASSATADRPAS